MYQLAVNMSNKQFRTRWKSTLRMVVGYLRIWVCRRTMYDTVVAHECKIYVASPSQVSTCCFDIRRSNYGRRSSVVETKLVTIALRLMLMLKSNDNCDIAVTPRKYLEVLVPLLVKVYYYTNLLTCRHFLLFNNASFNHN